MPGSTAVALGVLRSSTDGRSWVNLPSPNMLLHSNIVGDGRTWLWETRDRPSGTNTSITESIDQGRSWSWPQDLPPNEEYWNSHPIGCDGAVFVAHARSTWQRTYPTGWRELPKSPAGTTVGGCTRGLLVAANYASDGYASFVSPDRGQTWVPVGRPWAATTYYGGRWWSIGESSVTLWPQ
jgi:hypothetical protein